MKTIGQILALTALLTSTILAQGCAPKPPPNLYDPNTQVIYDVTQLTKDLTALSRTAVALNTGTPKRLSDADTRIVEAFARSADQGMAAYTADPHPGVLISMKVALQNMQANLSPQGNATLSAAIQVLVSGLATLAPAGG